MLVGNEIPTAAYADAAIEGKALDDAASDCPDGGTPCGALCTDLQTDKDNCSQCGHSCLGGACKDGVCQPVTLFANAGVANGIAVDPGTDGFLFWTDYYGGNVWRMPKDGSHQRTPIYEASGSSEWTNWIVVSTQSVYWTTNVDNGGRGAIHISGRDGENHRQLDLPHVPWDLALESDTIYFTESLGWGGIYRSPLDLSETTLLFGGPDAGAADPDLLFAEQGKTGLLFWTAGDGVHSMQKDGSGHLLVNPSAWSTGIVSDGARRVFWADSKRSWIVSAPRGAACTGSCPEELGPASGTMRIAMDDRFVYWGNSGGEIKAVTHDGAKVLTLANVPGLPWAVAIDDLAVYWVTQAGDVDRKSPGGVYKVAKPPG
jgi:hypothetical protein